MDEEFRHAVFVERARAAGYQDPRLFFARVYRELSIDQKAAIEKLYPLDEILTPWERAVLWGAEWVRAKSQVESGVPLSESFLGEASKQNAEMFEDFIKSEKGKSDPKSPTSWIFVHPVEPITGHAGSSGGGLKLEYSQMSTGAKRLRELSAIAAKRSLHPHELEELVKLLSTKSSSNIQKQGGGSDGTTKQIRALGLIASKRALRPNELAILREIAGIVSQEAEKFPGIPYRSATAQEMKRESRSPAWMDVREGNIVVNAPAMAKEKGLQKGSAQKRVAMTFDEESTHLLDKSAGNARGKRYGELQERAWRESPPAVKSALKRVYNAKSSTERGAELIRMLDQLSRKGETTEATAEIKKLDRLTAAKSQNNIARAYENNQRRRQLSEMLEAARQGQESSQPSAQNKETNDVTEGSLVYNGTPVPEAQNTGENYAANDQSTTSGSIETSQDPTNQDGSVDAASRQQQPDAGGNPAGDHRSGDGAVSAGERGREKGSRTGSVSTITTDGKGVAGRDSRWGIHSAQFQPEEASSPDNSASLSGGAGGVGKFENVVKSFISDYTPIVKNWGYDMALTDMAGVTLGADWKGKKLYINTDELCKTLLIIHKQHNDPHAALEAGMDEELRHIMIDECIIRSGYENPDDFNRIVYFGLTREQRNVIKDFYPLNKNIPLKRRAEIWGAEWLRAKSQVESGMQLPELFQGEEKAKKAKAFESFIKSESKKAGADKRGIRLGDGPTDVISGFGGARFEQQIKALKLNATRCILLPEERDELELLQHIVADGSYAQQNTPARKAIAEVMAALSREVAKQPGMRCRSATKAEMRREPHSPAWMDVREGSVVVNAPAMAKEKGLQKGSPQKRVAMTFDEESTHLLDKSAGNARGKRYGELQERAWRESPPAVKSALKRVYNAKSSTERGAELIRMLDQLSRKGETTEATMPGKHTAPLRRELRDWSKPTWLANHLGKMAELRDHSRSKPAQPPVESQALPGVRTRTTALRDSRNPNDPNAEIVLVM